MKKFFLFVLLGIAGFAITLMVGCGVFAILRGVFALLSIKSVAVVIDCVFYAFLALGFFYLFGLMVYDAITSWGVGVQYIRKRKLRNRGKN